MREAELEVRQHELRNVEYGQQTPSSYQEAGKNSLLLGSEATWLSCQYDFGLSVCRAETVHFCWCKPPSCSRSLGQPWETLTPPPQQNGNNDLLANCAKQIEYLYFKCFNINLKKMNILLRKIKVYLDMNENI